MPNQIKNLNKVFVLEITFLLNIKKVYVLNIKIWVKKVWSGHNSHAQNNELKT